MARIESGAARELHLAVTPEGRCPVCKLWCFVDGLGQGLTGRLRGHNTNDLGEIRRAVEKAARDGKRSPRLPSCRGSEQAPVEVRWPDGEPYLGEAASVRIQWPDGTMYWEGP